MQFSHSTEVPKATKEEIKTYNFFPLTGEDLRGLKVSAVIPDEGMTPGDKNVGKQSRRERPDPV